MNYINVIEKIKSLNFTKIVVTGPQRSGTTIATKILSHELGYRCQLEEEFGVYNLMSFTSLIEREDRVVIQAPAMSSLCHYLPTAVIFMKRNIDDISRSQQRIGWKFELLEKQMCFCDSNEPVAQIKYGIWDKYQKPHLKDRAFDLDYESLQNHAFWVSKEKRLQFKPRQFENVRIFL
jgi:hypothetical protein